MKFVIQHHITEPEHYDLMVEKSDILATWQISVRDIISFESGTEIAAVKIQDHRKKYLSYEGPVSCDRGRIEIHDTGEYTEKLMDDKNLKISIKGKKLKGLLNIKLKKSDQYIIKLTPETY